MSKKIDIDFKKLTDIQAYKRWFKAQPRYVLYGGGLILLGAIFLIIGLILL